MTDSNYLRLHGLRAVQICRGAKHYLHHANRGNSLRAVQICRGAKHGFVFSDVPERLRAVQICRGAKQTHTDANARSV